jgi:hypothetical protein
MTIPAEIEREARTLAEQEWLTKPEKEALADKIARALLARDERAAEKCDTFDAPPSDSDFVMGQATAAQQIRAAILTYSESPK